MPTQNGRPGFRAPLQNQDFSVGPRSLSRNNYKYAKDYFLSAQTSLKGGGAAGGTAGNVNVLRTGNPWAVEHEYGIVGTQTITGPVLTAAGGGGLDVTMDETLSDGLEIAFGGPQDAITRGKLCFTIGTDRPFFARLRVYLADVSGGVVYFGFRKVQAFAAALATYTDYATIGLNDDLGNISTATKLNNAAQVTTDTLVDWVDATSRELKILVGGPGVGTGSGAVQYFINGRKQFQPPAYTFDVGDVVFPFFRHVHSTDVGDDVILVGSIGSDYCFEAGYQKQFGSFDGV